MKKIIIMLSVFFTLGCFAQQPIEFIVKAAVGGPDDIITRKLVDHLHQTTDMKFVVVNKPGAGHAIAYSYFETYQGPSLIIGDVNMNAHSVFLLSNHIFTLGEFTNVLFVRKASGIQSLDDLIKLSRTREIKFGHGGIGSFSHIAATKICDSVIQCLLVPYKSGAPAMIDLMTGQIDAYSLISYGSDVYMSNDLYTPILMYSNTKHPKYNVPLLPNNLKNIEIKNSISLYSRNISDKQNKQIIKSLSSLNKTFFIDSGLWVK